MIKDLPENTANQISLVSINRDKPLIISDADEVLVVFMARFELFLKSQDCFFDWSSFRLTGNIHRKSDNYTFSQEEVLSLLDRFFAEETLDLDAVPGAIKALQFLSSRAQVVILSNVPSSYHNERKKCLIKHGMNYPLIVNDGLKGPAVKALAGMARAPVFFIDDSPKHIESVATLTDHVRRIHFVHDPRLAELVGPAPDSHYRIDTWSETRATIEKELSAAGF